MSTSKNRAIRPQVLVTGDTVRAPQIAGLLVRAGVRCASYVPEFAGGTPGFGMGALASSARVIVETLDYPLDAKRELLSEVAQAAQPGTVILSSGLGMTADEIALALDSYNLVVAFGVLELEGRARGVELTPASGSEPESLARATQFWRDLRFEPVVVGDTPGMVTPRIVCCVINEAAWALGEGISSSEDLDTAMKLGASHPEGPLRRADSIGVHRVVAVLQNLQDYYGEERYRTAPLLRRLVLQGRLGTEFGRGFYEYAEASDGHGDRTH